MKECVICGRPNSEKHHRIFRSECKPLEHCKKNIVYLCSLDHRGTYGVHGKHGNLLNIKLKQEFQKWLEDVFDKDFYTLDEIRKKLEISQNAIRSLSKLMDIEKNGYSREKIIRTCMGGKMF